MASWHRRKPARPLLGALVFAGLASAPLIAQSAELSMFDALAKGSWNLRFRDNGAQTQRICLRSGRELIQLKHKQPGCSRFVVTDKPDEIVVQYTCPGNGYGRTSVRRESNALVQVQTQGIYNGTPFSHSGEARHSGSC
jgi:hypothetical protein